MSYILFPLKSRHRPRYSPFFHGTAESGKEPSMDTKSNMPRVESSLRHQILKMPEATYEASGIVVNGRRIKSFVFTTDLAIIRNCDADAVFAVYPFTPQQLSLIHI